MELALRKLEKLPGILSLCTVLCNVPCKLACSGLEGQVLKGLVDVDALIYGAGTADFEIFNFSLLLLLFKRKNDFLIFTVSRHFYLTRGRPALRH